MARNNIGFEGCRHVASALLHNRTLTELDIGGVNYLTIAGSMQLAQAICYHKYTKLAWLTVGERRLPIAALIGDRSLLDDSRLDAELQAGRPSVTSPLFAGGTSRPGVVIHPTSLWLESPDKANLDAIKKSSKEFTKTSAHGTYLVSTELVLS